MYIPAITRFDRYLFVMITSIEYKEKEPGYMIQKQFSVFCLLDQKVVVGEESMYDLDIPQRQCIH